MREREIERFVEIDRNSGKKNETDRIYTVQFCSALPAGPILISTLQPEKQLKQQT